MMSDFNFGGKPARDDHGDKSSPFAYQGPPPPAKGMTSDERTWGMLCHLSTLAGYVIPFGNIIGPLVVWLVKRDESPLVEDQGREALNFQISVTIYSVICIVLALVIIGILLLIALAIFDIIVTIMAAIKASEGEYYRYPLCIRFIS